jgi:glutathione S-transferase
LSQPTLYQFAGSHFNEKARWALDWKSVSHERRSLLPGPHAFTMKRLTGKTQVPALRDDGEVIAGSAQIIDHLERKGADRPIYPQDAALRERALEIQRDFDERVGPATRLALFFELLDGEYASATFGADHGATTRRIYRACFPVVKRVIDKSLAIDAESAAAARAITREGLDFVAQQPGPGGYLVGDAFSVADLCCASLLMPAVDVSALGGPTWQRGPKLDAWLARWADHPGAQWVREIYRRHRRPEAQ